MLLEKTIQLLLFKHRNRNKGKFICPLCNYKGAFDDVAQTTGIRKHAMCPKCNALERHRLQKLVVDVLLKKSILQEKNCLHFAPEPFFKRYFREIFKTYTAVDYCMNSVDLKVNAKNLPFKDAAFDFVFASHVLEHIQDDTSALLEIRRILQPGGLAMMPVPILGEKTIEYDQPNPCEAGHVRAPGIDYYERYKKYFSRVERFTSDDFNGAFQLFVYEDRSLWPTKEMPLRRPMPGERHIDIVPVCYV